MSPAVTPPKRNARLSCTVHSPRSPPRSPISSDPWPGPRLPAPRRRVLCVPISISSPSAPRDRKSTRLNSSHVAISYAVFCLKKKKTIEVEEDYKESVRDDGVQIQRHAYR